MAHVKKGSKVKVYYTCKLKDGTVFESNIGKTPLEFVVGKGKVIKGFDSALVGMDLGQTKTATFKPSEAYGLKDRELIWTVPIEELPSGTDLQQGVELAFSRADGSQVEGRIDKIEGNQVTIDGNHPLAGQSLTFEIKLAAVK
ncbi:MAG: peptidylprolyl isomerase [Desulfobulbaceae bacterium]|nr:peptidylprolyl isomerase [Desulfobulbaceae bacterium]